MTEKEILRYFARMNGIELEGNTEGGHNVSVYDKNGDEIAMLCPRFNIISFYDESIFFNKVTPAIIKEKIKNFAIREKLYAIQERIVKANGDFI
jgi:hypothetical protein